MFERSPAGLGERDKKSVSGEELGLMGMLARILIIHSVNENVSIERTFFLALLCRELIEYK